MIVGNEISVLLFHRISNDSDQLWPSMQISVFQKLIDKLYASVEIISFSDLKKINQYNSKPLVIISFDDGYLDFYENALPILAARNIKANHNICPGLIETATPPWTQVLSLYLSYRTSNDLKFNTAFLIAENEHIDENKFIEICKQLLNYPDEKRSELVNPLISHIPKQKVYALMNWDQIKYCTLHHIEFGSHGNLHRNLLQVTDSKVLQEEIDESCHKLEAQLGYRPSIFAFANAVGNDISRQFVQHSFYQFILISMDKLYKWSPINAKDKIEIPRINIARNDWREEYLRALGFHTRIKKLIKIF
jgi:peptidoglycan/xylan/chitin deacetylase (PgdA/CDA1 family)